MQPAKSKKINFESFKNGRSVRACAIFNIVRSSEFPSICVPYFDDFDILFTCLLIEIAVCIILQQ
jgi:hypothetical protein